MPFYSYKCNKCLNTFKSFHSPDEVREACIICSSENITKLLSVVRTINNTIKENSAKDRVEKFIEESRETLKQQKEEVRKELK